MSTEPVQATIAGQTVEGTILDTLPQADFGNGPQDVYLVEYSGSTYRVPEDDVE